MSLVTLDLYTGHAMGISVYVLWSAKHNVRIWDLFVGCKEVSFIHVHHTLDLYTLYTLYYTNVGIHHLLYKECSSSKFADSGEYLEIVLNISLWDFPMALV